MRNWYPSSSLGIKWSSIASDSSGILLIASSDDTSYGGIYLSSTSGVSWTIVSDATLPSNIGNTDYVAVTSNSDGLYLAVCYISTLYGNYIYTSYNSGTSWNTVTGLLTNIVWTGIASDSTGQYLVACSSNAGIYTSGDFGASWTLSGASTLLDWTCVASNSTGQYLVACSSNAGIYTSANFGASWTLSGALTLSWTGVASNSTGDVVVACATNNYIYTSYNYGATWTEVGNSTIQNWTGVASDSSGLNFVAVIDEINPGQGGIYTSPDSGVNWYMSTTITTGSPWSCVTSDSAGLNLAAGGDTSIIYITACFLEGSKILTSEGYISIENLKKGDLIKTFNGDFIPIIMLGKKEIYHSASEERIEDQLYKCCQDKYPEIFEDLVITGRHSVLVEEFIDENQKERTRKVNNGILTIENKYRLPSCADERAVVYETPGKYTIYHFALENDDDYLLHGIYANGLLVETTSKHYLREVSTMTLY